MEHSVYFYSIEFLGKSVSQKYRVSWVSTRWFGNVCHKTSSFNTKDPRTCYKGMFFPPDILKNFVFPFSFNIFADTGATKTQDHFFKFFQMEHPPRFLMKMCLILKEIIEMIITVKIFLSNSIRKICKKSKKIFEIVNLQKMFPHAEWGIN